MTPFHHHGGIDTQYISRFQIRQGDRSAGLSWEMRDGDGQPREVLVFQSMQRFVENDGDPTGDFRQRLVYQGNDLHIRLSDADPSGDIAYYYPDDISYYYSVFAKGDDGDWICSYKKAAPRSVGYWQRPDSEGRQGRGGGGRVVLAARSIAGSRLCRDADRASSTGLPTAPCAASTPDHLRATAQGAGLRTAARVDWWARRGQPNPFTPI